VPVVLAVGPRVDAVGLRILVADDDPSVRMLLRVFLERCGYQVVEAGSALEIFEVLETQRPDVLLVDINLGTEDGRAIGAGLRQEKQYSSLRVILMSGGVDAGEVRRLSRLWNLPILIKPFDFDALLTAIVPPDADR
jgi:CheY-like chemotaxis protein